jgi:hypothetical protein
MQRNSLISFGFALAALLPLALSPAFAADTGGGGAGGGAGGGSILPPPSGNPTRDPGNLGRQAALPGLDLEGKVVDAAGAPVGGVRVKMFASGIIAGSTRTASDGTFRLEANPMRGERITTDLWFESPDPDQYIDVNVVLSAARNGLFPPCTTRITTRPEGSVIEVTMLSADQMQEQLKRTECLEGGTVQGPAAP